MRRLILAIALLGASNTAQAAVIETIVNTGLGALNSVDANWTINGGNAFVGNPLNSNWLANNTTSKWLTPASDGRTSFDPVNATTRLFELTFSLDGFSPFTAAFNGRFAVDNAVTSIKLNGTTINGSGGSFNRWTAFSSVPGAFVAGDNTLTFAVLNTVPANPNPTGLRVEFLSATASVPEPASWALMIGGFAAAGAAARRRRMELRASFC
jgi:hypothetical protein